MLSSDTYYFVVVVVVVVINCYHCFYFFISAWKTKRIFNPREDKQNWFLCPFRQIPL